MIKDLVTQLLGLVLLVLFTAGCAIKGSCNATCLGCSFASSRDSRPPALHPLDMLGPAKVVAVLGFLQPPPLAVGLAMLAASGLCAVPLTGGIAGIGGE